VKQRHTQNEKYHAAAGENYVRCYNAALSVRGEIL